MNSFQELAASKPEWKQKRDQINNAARKQAIKASFDCLVEEFTTLQAKMETFSTK